MEASEAEMKKERFKRTFCIVLAAVLLATAAGATGKAQGEQGRRRGVTPEDYFAFEFLSDPRLSPDGQWAAYIVTTVDQKQNRRQSQIWLASVDGNRPPRQFTTSPRWSPDGRSLAFISARPSTDAATPPPQPTPQRAPQPGEQIQTQPTPYGSPAPPQTTGMPAPAGAIGTATTPGVPSALQGAAAAGEAAPRSQVYVLSLDGGEARRVTNLKNGVSGFDWSPDGTRLVVTSRAGPSAGTSGSLMLRAARRAR